METFRLICHPDTPAKKIEGVEGWFDASETGFVINFEVWGATPKLGIEGSGRTDGLWTSTCFELFVKPEPGDAYSEFNFAPRGAWAAYSFVRYRDGQTNLQVMAPWIEPIESGIRITGQFGAGIGKFARIALSAVIEETDGTKSYWALAHPPGKPDFHHPACFAAVLPPPSKT